MCHQPKSRTERARKTKIRRSSSRHSGHHFQGQKVKGQLAGAGAYCGLPHSLLLLLRPIVDWGGRHHLPNPHPLDARYQRLRRFSEPLRKFFCIRPLLLVDTEEINADCLFTSSRADEADALGQCDDPLTCDAVMMNWRRRQQAAA